MTLLYLVRELPCRCASALLIGHNPGIAELAGSLAAGYGPGQGIRFPTAAAAVFEFAGDWAGLDPGGARLVDSVIPADLRLLTPRSITKCP
jgi:phosphohistidine phosphatase